MSNYGRALPQARAYSYGGGTVSLEEALEEKHYNRQGRSGSQNPDPSGRGEVRGLGDMGPVPAPCQPRPVRATANGKRWSAKDFKPDDRQATGDTEPEGSGPYG